MGAVVTAVVHERTEPELALSGEVREQQQTFALEYMKPGRHKCEKLEILVQDIKFSMLKRLQQKIMEYPHQS